MKDATIGLLKQCITGLPDSDHHNREELTKLASGLEGIEAGSDQWPHIHAVAAELLSNLLVATEPSAESDPTKIQLTLNVIVAQSVLDAYCSSIV